jgi:hypothetical protein
MIIFFFEKGADELIANSRRTNKIREYTLPFGEINILARIQQAKDKKLFEELLIVKTMQAEITNTLYKAVASSYKKGIFQIGSGFNSSSYTKISLKNICAD